MRISGRALRRVGVGSISPSSVNVQFGEMRTSSNIVGGKVGEEVGETDSVGDADGATVGAKLSVGSRVGWWLNVGEGVAEGRGVG